MSHNLSGIKVTNANGVSIVGVIIGVSQEKIKNNYWAPAHEFPKTVKVLWGTGKKRGKIEDKDPQNLINFDLYLEAVKKEYSELEELSLQASTVGM